MANRGSGAPTAPAGAGGPRPAPLPPLQSESVQQKRDLASWWRNFKRNDKKLGHEQQQQLQQQQQQRVPRGIFGIPLQQSIRYANVAISLYNDDGQSYIYGYVPIVVAKCGVFLKEKATDVEGIFRLAGSEKRIKELKAQFDSPDRYGKGLDWTGYTVHDAANILRRYFNLLPEPIIPLEFYERFREPLRNHQAQAVGALEAQSPSVGDFNHVAAIKVYQGLITELPPLNRQLLLYILDLLAVFASKSDLNKMTTANLAAIFQPGILSHPQHDMAPEEYRLSQDVLIFLIENQDSFLIGMQGTAADPETVRDVQSGQAAPGKPPQPGTPTTPSRSKTVMTRTSSNASAGAESVRKWGNVRRNVSVSSKHSKRSEAGPTPVLTQAGGGSGVHRSNTAPSRRGGSAAQSPRFPRDKTSDPPTPSPRALAADGAASRHESIQSTPVAGAAPAAFPPVAPVEVTSASSSEVPTPLPAAVGSDDASSTVHSDNTAAPKKDTTPLLSPLAGTTELHSGERSPSNTPSTVSGRGFLDLFKQSPTSDGEGRKPNKLQKKRIPGSALSSAQSSSHSLHDGHHESTQKSPVLSGLPAAITESQGEKDDDQSTYATAHTTPPRKAATPQRNPTDATLRPTASPTHSFHSTDLSDADLVGDDLPPSVASPPDQEKKKHRWRFSRTQNKLDDTAWQPPASGAANPLGTLTPKEQATSRSTVGSSSISGQPRQSFQEPTPLGVAGAVDSAIVASPPTATSHPSTTAQPPPAPFAATSSSTDPVFSDSEREKRGPMKWIRGKLQERKDKEAEKRAKTPERHRDPNDSKHDLAVPADAGPPARAGKLLDQPRAGAPAPRGTSFEQPRPVQSPPVEPTGAGGEAAASPPTTAATAPPPLTTTTSPPVSSPPEGHEPSDVAH